jgi:Asp-tRNA(Asn)/Glu-tRNA(Gln) amidotransferase A subunit family amidase
LPHSDLSSLTATRAAAEIARGVMSAEDYTRACLDRIAAVDGEVQAFIHLDPEHALAQAQALDRHKAGGGRIGPLHGIPVGIKDIFDTADYPTECGSPILAGRRPAADAAAVRKLREAGAVIIGKTVTTEFAYFIRARRAIHAILHAPRAARRRARPRRWPPAWCRWQSDRKPTAR